MRTLLIVAVAACASGQRVVDDEVIRVGSPYLSTDWCDDDAMTSVPFRSFERDRVRIDVLPGTAAERDAASILARHVAARDRIARALGVRDERTLVVRLAPSRAAAKSHHMEAGMAFPAQARIEALYLDAEDSYEHLQYGHEVTHVLAWLLDPTPRAHLKLVEEGLAEVFDQSGRDLNRELANVLLASDKTIADVTGFDQDDVFGRNYAKAGSFMQTLLAMDGDPSKLARFYARSRWDRDLDAGSLTKLIDANLVAVYGTRLDTFRARWTDQLERAAKLGPVLVSQSETEQLAALLALRDQALAQKDPSLLRATMEGFYCDAISDQERGRHVARVLASVTGGHSKLVHAFATGIKNYATAVLVIDKDVRGRTKRVRGYAERFPIGWRLVRVNDEIAVAR
jgi:hypothetical protein